MVGGALSPDSVSLNPEDLNCNELPDRLLEAVDLGGRTGICIGGEAEGWSSVIVRADPASC